MMNDLVAFCIYTKQNVFIYKLGITYGTVNEPIENYAYDQYRIDAKKVSAFALKYLELNILKSLYERCYHIIRIHLYTIFMIFSRWDGHEYVALSMCYRIRYFKYLSSVCMIV